MVRVHPELLDREKTPTLVSKDLWEQRYKDINAFERRLTGNGIVVLKFFLHLSKKEQKKRFFDRLDDPNKNWKFSMNDALERQYWDEYRAPQGASCRNTDTSTAVVHHSGRSQVVLSNGGHRSDH